MTTPPGGFTAARSKHGGRSGKIDVLCEGGEPQNEELQGALSKHVLGFFSPHSSIARDIGGLSSASNSERGGFETPQNDSLLQPGSGYGSGGQTPLLEIGVSTTKTPILTEKMLRRMLGQHSEISNFEEGASHTFEEPRNAPPPQGQKHARSTPQGSPDSELSQKRLCSVALSRQGVGGVVLPGGNIVDHQMAGGGYPPPSYSSCVTPVGGGDMPPPPPVRKEKERVAETNLGNYLSETQTPRSVGFRRAKSNLFCWVHKCNFRFKKCKNCVGMCMQ